MIRKYTHILLMQFVLCIASGFGQYNYDPIEMSYFPESWYFDPGTFKGAGSLPDSGLTAASETVFNEPMFCYPYHSGNVKSVSDTVSIVVSIVNYDTVDFSLSSYQPEAWFMPALWDLYLDPRKFQPRADTTVLSYTFAGWFNGLDNPVSQPSSITKNRGRPRYYLLYYVTNLPIGRNRLLMRGTANLITEVDMVVGYVRPIWVENPSSIADTLNAYGACFWRALRQKTFTAAVSWTDSMLAKHSTSLPGYMLRARGYSALGDSLNEGTALDSALAIFGRYGDAALGDTSTWNDYERHWYDANRKRVEFDRWKLIHSKKYLKNI